MIEAQKSKNTTAKVKKQPSYSNSLGTISADDFLFECIHAERIKLMQRIGRDASAVPQRPIEQTLFFSSLRVFQINCVKAWVVNYYHFGMVVGPVTERDAT